MNLKSSLAAVFMTSALLITPGTLSETENTGIAGKYKLGGDHAIERSYNRIITGDSLATLANQASVRRAVIPRERGTSDLQGGDISAIIARYFPENYATAYAVAKCESNLRPEALGDTNTKWPSAGIFQIRLLPERGLTKEAMFQAEANVAYARKLYERSGFYPWSCWKSGAYRKYL